MTEFDHLTLLDPKEVSRILRVSLAYVYKMSERGVLPSVRWETFSESDRKRTVLRFTKEDVLGFIKAHRAHPVVEQGNN